MLNTNDRQLIESQVPNPTDKPSYESVKGCLYWPDELPTGLSLEGLKFILRLLAARSYLHRNIPVEGRLEYLKIAWEGALRTELKWSGFSRIQIPPHELQYLLDQMRLEAEYGSV